MTVHPIVERLATTVVGRRREAEVLVAALDADRHVLLEGPPGTGKSTLLRVIAAELGVGFEFVEGNAELTPARLVGHFDPARVLAEGYDPRVFVDGPLVAALRGGALLYLEELNRVPEETLNVLVTVMSEHELTVPRLGRIDAAPGFRLVAAMNPYDAVGTARISSTIYDRLCRLSVDYQSDVEEQAIVRRSLGQPTLAGGGADGALDDHWLARAVDVVRRTRVHPEIRVGSSVRGAIDMSAVARSLADVRGASPDEVSLDAALVALSGRIRLREGSDRTTEDVITEIWRSVFGGDVGGATGKAAAPAGAVQPG
ncbi:MAG: MoxR family ATPase [Actinobacteria bacterium]|nr:MoxR family ATPase [Actinomycetota bacterium]